jgi:hypothetical protein
MLDTKEKNNGQLFCLVEYATYFENWTLKGESA